LIFYLTIEHLVNRLLSEDGTRKSSPSPTSPLKSQKISEVGTLLLIMVNQHDGNWKSTRKGSSFMSESGFPFSSERIFTLSEANGLIPELEQLWGNIKTGRQILVDTREEVKKASAQASLGGGTVVGVQYIKGLQDINGSLHAIQELGVVIKDVEIGLCDFPFLLDDRLVFLCWKSGEEQVRWWHDIDSGFADRQPIEDTNP